MLGKGPRLEDEGVGELTVKGTEICSMNRIIALEWECKREVS